jgi:glucosamine-6-phosphate deaminase
MNHTYGQNRWEKIPVRIESTAQQCADAVAAEIEDLIRRNEEKRRPTVLGLATGSTPRSVYRALARRHREANLSFRRVVTFNLDEYFPLKREAPQSYHRYMWENFFSHVDILKENVHIPDGNISIGETAEHCREYDERIRAAGGVELQLLGIGRTGHIGFNEPGSQLKSRTRVITLDHITRGDAAPDWQGLHHVPSRAITMGIRTILEARRIILMATGEHKAAIIRATVEGGINEEVPASFLQNHDNVTCVLDPGAARDLTRLQTPWLLGPLPDQGLVWDEGLIVRAVLWLAAKTAKAILKLTDEDYNSAGLQELLATVGSAYDLNLIGFYKLQNAITGWPGGKKDGNKPRPLKAISASVFPKRVLIFSPHPDDDVISMGGTLARLAEHGHEVHIAYQVSGANAVPEEMRERYGAFVTEFKVERQDDTVLNKKRPQRAFIRQLEARAAARISGIPDEHLHFLNLPFYEESKTSERVVTENDVSIVKKLLEQIQPHQIYAAGDLNDPHGTHRLCLEVIHRSWTSLRDSLQLQPEIWLYRGAWGEWSLHETDMAVPLSPGEVLRKRRAIFQHESQKDQAIVLGEDRREFWQRVEARNRATANAFNLLGLAEYEAIETFSRWVPSP